MDRMQEKERRRRRRNDRERMKARARRVARTMFWWQPTFMIVSRGRLTNEEWIDRYANTHADNMKSCSCSMCGNQRRSMYNKGRYRLTMQEKKFEDSFQEELRSEGCDNW
jgi:hypothetical protein